jgi:hypothetical protein
MAAKPTRPFGCHKCSSRYGEGYVYVERGQNTRTVGGRKRTVVNAVCNSPQCGGREWWSYHPDAIKEAKRLDKAVAGSQ